MNLYNDLKKGLEQAIEIEKHKKKKQSNTSKSKYKSNHKHNKTDCLLMNNDRLYYASYCTICGKIHNWKAPTIKIENGYKMMDTDEILQMYKDLEQIQVDNLWNKYIPIEIIDKINAR